MEKKQINSFEPFREQTDPFCEQVIRLKNKLAQKEILFYQLRKTLNNSLVVRKVSNRMYSYCHTLKVRCTFNKMWAQNVANIFRLWTLLFIFQKSSH